MSQAGIINTQSGPPPPPVPTSFVTDVNSPSIPIANVENVFGGTSTINNNKGIQTDGSSGSNTLTVQLTNRVQGQTTTANAAPTNIISFGAGATPGTYVIDGTIGAFDTTDIASAAYFFTAGIRTTGAATVLIGLQFSTEFEEAALAASDIDISVSGNNILVVVTGIAAKSIDWDAIFTYRFVS